MFLPVLKGNSLETVLKNFGPIPDIQILCKYALHMVLALQFLHDRGVYHNNVCSATLFWDHKGHLKLADYGISPLLPSHTPHADLIKYDIWSMGATLLHAATGRMTNVYDFAKVFVLFLSGIEFRPDMKIPEMFPVVFTAEAVDFVRAAIQNPKHRPSSMAFFVNHPFICSENESVAGFVASTPPSMGVGIPLTSFSRNTVSLKSFRKCADLIFLVSRCLP